MAKTLFTSESVTEGHPDKICDQISDAVLDAILEQDPKARVACETTTATGMVLCIACVLVAFILQYNILCLYIPVHICTRQLP